MPVHRIKNYVIVPRCTHVDYATLFCEREVIKFVKYVVKDYQKLKPIIGYKFYNRKPMLFMHMTGNCDTKWDIEVFEHYSKCDTARA